MLNLKYARAAAAEMIWIPCFVFIVGIHYQRSLKWRSQIRSRMIEQDKIKIKKFIKI